MDFKDPKVVNKLKQIRLLLLDVDGVLTDGSIIYNSNGTETKVFNVKDGLGIRLLKESGIEVGIITGRSSSALNHRCKNLGIVYIFDNVLNKAEVLTPILKKTGIRAEEVAFVGDDLLDLPLMRKVGLSIAVADAHDTIIKNARVITLKKGGTGAVREVCEEILKAQGLWGKNLERFTTDIIK